MNDPFDKLKQIWQDQAHEPFDKARFLKQAKLKKLRMFLFLTFDVVCTLAGIAFSIYHLTQHQEITDIVFSIFLASAVSFAMGISLWSRRGLWGSETLDIRSTLKLSINRCESGISVVHFSYIFLAVMIVFIYSWHIWRASDMVILLQTSTLPTLLFCGSLVLYLAFYKKKQVRLIKAYRQQLKRLDQIDEKALSESN